jgi:hypothetical protein
VRNEGLLDAPASTLKLTLVSTGAVPAQTKLGEMAVPGLLAGKQAQLDATPSVDELTPPGTYTLQGCADYNKKVPESFEKNNCATALGTVTVTGLPPSLADLAVTALTPPPATRLPGESFPLTATVQNHGTETSPSTTNKFYLVNAVVNRRYERTSRGFSFSIRSRRARPTRRRSPSKSTRTPFRATISSRPARTAKSRSASRTKTTIAARRRPRSPCQRRPTSSCRRSAILPRPPCPGRASR